MWDAGTRWSLSPVPLPGSPHLQPPKAMRTMVFLYISSLTFFAGLAIYFFMKAEESSDQNASDGYYALFAMCAIAISAVFAVIGMTHGTGASERLPELVSEVLTDDEDQDSQEE